MPLISSSSLSLGERAPAPREAEAGDGQLPSGQLRNSPGRQAGREGAALHLRVKMSQGIYFPLQLWRL